MIQINQTQKNELERVGLLQNKITKNGVVVQEQNYVVVNRDHKSRHKTYYAVETFENMMFLEHYEDQNMLKLSPGQMKYLHAAKKITEDQIQRHGTYNPKAIIFENAEGEYRIKKVSSTLIALGIWQDNKSRRQNGSQNSQANNQQK